MMGERQNSILKTNDLTIGFFQEKQSVKIVEQIELNIQYPSLIAVLGKNGEGKSTLLRSLAKLQPTINGKIYYNNQEISKIKTNDLAKILAVVLTETPKDCIFSVSEMVAFGRFVYTDWTNKLSENDQIIIENAMRATEILPLKDKLFANLSDGQRQKVMIARALVQDTPVILLDEPTVHLDVHHTMEMFQLFRELVDIYKKTIILTTHEIGLATRLSDEIWIIQDGKLMANSTKNVLKNRMIEIIFNTDNIRFNQHNFTFEYVSNLIEH